MRRQMGHPDTEALANFRAGLVRGIRGRQIAVHIASCERCTLVADQLSAVTWALASIPEPSLPEAVERRIGAALAAEAVARQVASLASDSSAAVFLAADAASPAVRSGVNGSKANDVAADTATSDRAGAEDPRFRFRLSLGRLLVPTAACLLFAGLGYLLSVPGAAGMPSSATPGTPRATSASLPPKPVISTGPHRDAIGPSANGSMAARQGDVVFLVTVSATRYRKSTLGAQVRGQLAGQVPSPVITNLAGNQDGPANTTFVPSPSLVGCVLHLTKDVPPAFVQRATYQAEPAYVIAIPDRAWVVGLACTAARPALITSVVLAPVG